MDEKTTNEAVETAESNELEAVDAAFDEVWSNETPEDDDFDLSEGAADETPDAQPEETEAAAETTEEQTDSDSSSEQQESEPTEEKKPEEQNQLFKIRVNGEDKLVTLAEMTELAQKGSDYDRVKQERDSFKQDAPTMQKFKAYESFLKELADGSNSSIDELIDGTRARLLMQKAEEKGETLSEEDAMAKAKAARQSQAEPVGQESVQEAKGPDPEEANRQMLLKFLAIYPSVEPEKIPKEVWDDSYITGDLVGAYTRFESRQLAAKLVTLEQNNKNRERSTGSRRTAGATTPKDAFDEGWDSDI